MVRFDSVLLGVLVAMVLASWGMPCAAEVRALLDRNEVQLNESFGLVLEIDSDSIAQPDFSVLTQDFKILGRFKSSNVSVIDGDYTAITRWNLDLMAKRPGELTVPAIMIGTEASEPTKVKVTQTGPGAPQNADLFVEIDVDPREAYVQQQIIVTLRLFIAVNPLDLRLTPLAVSNTDAVVEQLGGDEEFGTTRGAKRYRVIQRRYVIFPQSSGTLSIDPVVAEARVSKRGLVTFGRTSLLRSQSEAIDIAIKAIPAAFNGKTWLPARKLEIVEGWSNTPPVFRVGEPITRTLRISSDGLASTQLPELTPYMPQDLKHYSDQPELSDNKSGSGVTGSRTERYAIIPPAEGDFLLPRIEIPWWNTDTDTQDVAVLQARTIQVYSAGKPSPATQTPLPSPAAEASDRRPPATQQDGLPWAWVSLGLALGWLLTVLFWSAGHLLRTTRPTGTARPDPKAARTALAKACVRHEAQAAKNALLHWSRAAWPEHSARNLHDIAARGDEALRIELRRLSETLYGRKSGDWRGHTLWEAFTKFEARPAQTDNPEPDALPPLYRT